MGRPTLVTPQIVDKIKELSAVECSGKEIINVIERDFNVLLHKMVVSDILTGQQHSSKGNFTEEDGDRIISHLDAVEETPDMSRIDMFGLTYLAKKKGVSQAMDHYNTTTEYALTEQKVDDIITEVEEWILEGNLKNENEEWFAQQISNGKEENTK